MLLKQQRELVQAGVVTEAQLVEAQQAPEAKTSGLLFALLQIPGIDDKALLHTLARTYKVPYLDLSNFKPDPKLLEQCSQAMCLEYGFIPVDGDGANLVVAIGDPFNYSALDGLRFKLGKQIRPIFARPDLIQRKIREFFQGEDSFDAAMNELEEGGGGLNLETVNQEADTANLDELRRGAEDSPIIKLVNGIVVKALKEGSSDIHIEPGENHSVVRLRVDGRLRPTLKFPSKVHSLVASRIKIMAKLDISNTRTPQDGRAKVRMWNKNFDMRISTLPAMYGEKVVIRILDKSGLSLKLDLLGFEKTADARVRECVTRPTGAVLVTGPTGSGKTTTLYSFLNHINDPETNMITVEDPVEFQIKGINQVQINAKAGMTFAAALRSILRQDPDVVMVGEIRDEETAEIALHAAQTGHLVLSTLHTNDAPSTVTRLREMGLDSTLLGSSLNLIVAQRLVRRLCPKCKVQEPPSEEDRERFSIPDGIMLYKPQGCDHCMNIGFKGRIGVHEVLYINDRLRELVSREVSDRDLMQAAREEGMFTLFEDGFAKALKGLTSLKEVMRMATPPEDFRLDNRLDEEGNLLSLGEAMRRQDKARVQQNISTGEKTILIVDDSNSVRQVVKFVLAADGFNVVQAEDGQQAWDMIQRMHPDMVISDFEMPNMNGPELVKRIREQSLFNDMPIMLLTSQTAEESEVLGLETGADDYISKPVEPLKLQARVKKMLAMYDRIRASSQHRESEA